jgi:hypothetical protein
VPIDTAFRQQRLPAWQPIITSNVALPVFLIIVLLFIPIGIVLIVTSERVRAADRLRPVTTNDVDVAS